MKSFHNMDIHDYETWQVMQEYLPKDLLNKYKKMFNTFDPDREGVIRVEDISTILRNMGHNITAEEVKDLLQQIIGTVASNSFIDFKEFIIIVSMMNTNCIAEDEMSKVFQHFDRDGDGFITLVELKDMMSSFGEEIGDDELEDMIRAADQDGDGKVSYNDFIRFMTNSTEQDTQTPMHAVACEEMHQQPAQILDNHNDTPEALLNADSNIDDDSPTSTIDGYPYKLYNKRTRRGSKQRVITSLRKGCKGIFGFFKNIKIQVQYNSSKKSFMKRFSVRTSRKVMG